MNTWRGKQTLLMEFTKHELRMLGDFMATHASDEDMQELYKTDQEQAVVVKDFRIYMVALRNHYA